ncbi:hypothetical protein NQS96_08730 [Pseudoalteromonas shioyasakiensis]|uniref:hypothetical protein n=1 Tax=Pseudoalteromonas shioyasakiensis TaxID=1190813 RepID=UPI002117F5E5|nr:hypothetical protein [Pseudoalteromonas shioyasakiensis]MCQ8881873.1 hypothetical protein [Pseudoalteromonas shioyasakiensis]
MRKNYIFDISKSEFKDDYSDGSEGELWQDYAKEQLLLNLNSILRDAKEYSRFRNSNSDLRDCIDETWLSHNAILVTSQRGSGKTVFLRNIKKIWAKSDNKSSELLFLKVIDPTMLMDNDSFANVIVAQIYDAVSRKLNTQTCCDDKSRFSRDEFHRYLKKLADSMGKTSEFNGSIGIDKILKYSSGIHLEKNFHNFVESAISILGCKAIVVLIDDVDMALDKAFEVVDDVRRFLGCPYIIPIVSGELKLYEHMTQNHFDDKAYNNHCRDTNLRTQGKKFSEDLRDAYLTKVFPASMRISLFPVERLLAQMQIKYGKNGEVIPFPEYQEKVFNQFYYLRHNSEARRNWPELTSAREFTQLVRTLHPDELEKKELTFNQEIALYNRLKNWAVQKKSGELMAFSETAITVLQNNNSNFDINNLLAFNIKKQIDSNIYHWAECKTLENQMLSLNTKGADSEENLSALKSVFEQDDRSLQSMPPLEFLYEKLFISKGAYKFEQGIKIQTPLENLNKINASRHGCLPVKNDIPEDFYIHNVLKDIYTESQIYTTLHNEREFIFFSRAFELIAYSFFKPKSEIVQVEDIYQILSRKPFYSLIRLAETKVAVKGEDDSDFQENLEETTSKSAAVLFCMMSSWQEKYSELCFKNSEARFIALLTYSFNSVFTAMNIIKGNISSRLKDEYLTDMILRFKYNLLNSIVRAGIYGEAIQANVLVWALPTTVRSRSKINNSERAYTRNHKKLVEQIDSCTEEQSDKKERLKEVKNLHDALSEHPVFSIFMDKNDEIISLLPIGNRPSGNAQSNLKESLPNSDNKTKREQLSDLIGEGYAQSVDYLLRTLKDRSGRSYIPASGMERVFKELLSESNITTELRFHYDHVHEAASNIDALLGEGKTINDLPARSYRNLFKAIINTGNF